MTDQLTIEERIRRHICRTTPHSPDEISVVQVSDAPTWRVRVGASRTLGHIAEVRAGLYCASRAHDVTPKRGLTFEQACAHLGSV